MHMCHVNVWYFAQMGPCTCVHVYARPCAHVDPCTCDVSDIAQSSYFTQRATSLWYTYTSTLLQYALQD